MEEHRAAIATAHMTRRVFLGTGLLAGAGLEGRIGLVVHSLFLLVTVLTLAPFLSLVPMSAMAAILIAVAWNMSEVHHVLHLIRTAPRSDVGVFFVCYGLTVIVDMQVAVAAGMLLAAAVFMRRMSELTSITLSKDHKANSHLAVKEGVVVFDVNGPLFFGAAHRALKTVFTVDRDVRKVILDLSNVPVIDTTGMVNIRSIANALEKRDINLYLYGAPEQIQTTLKRFGLGAEKTNVVISNDFSFMD